MTEHIAYRVEHDFTPMVDEIAAQIQHKVDQAALDKAAYTLEQFGYVKVVRCHDCKHFDNELDNDIGTCDLGLEDTGLFSIVESDGFCKWAERKNA